uniref:Uncharacterized protein n=1 Tax=viral metagenome TaxID=1070528 RepID=A0A6C0ILX3_9ZZZZ
MNKCMISINKITIVVLVILLIIFIVKSCNVREGFDGTVQIPIQEASSHFSQHNYFSTSENNYLASKIYKMKQDGNFNKSDEEIHQIWMDIYEQPNSTAARNKLYEYAQKEGISNEQLKLYTIHDIIELYAMKAYELPVKMETDPQSGGSYLVTTEENNKMHQTILKSTSIQQAKDLYTQYAETYPPIQNNYGDEDNHTQDVIPGEGEHHDYISEDNHTQDVISGEGEHHDYITEYHHTQDVIPGGGEHHDYVPEDHHTPAPSDEQAVQQTKSSQCLSKTCASGYNYRFTISNMSVGNKDGMSIFTINDLNDKIKTYAVDKKNLILREIVHNWEFEVDGVRYTPLLKCDHDTGIDDNTIRLVTEPPSPFKSGVVSEYKEVKWYQCGGIAQEKQNPPAEKEKDAPTETKGGSRMFDEKIPENTDDYFAPHDGQDASKQTGSLIDKQTIIDPPGILGPSSLMPSEKVKPVNIFITSNVGPYGNVGRIEGERQNTQPQNKQPQHMKITHSIGTKTNQQLTKSMNMMQHIMTTSQRR